MLQTAVVWLGLAALAGQARPLTVSAAVSLTEALEDLAAAYRKAGGDEIRFNFAASNVLARQIVNGAPVDVFISADELQMNVVERAGLVEPGTRVPLLGNELVIVVDASRHPYVKSASDLTAADVHRIAVGDPAAVPAGVYARQYLERLGLWTQLEPKIVPSHNVRAALSAVQNRSADAAIVYATDARVAPQLRIAMTVSGPDAPAIVYPVSVIRSTRHGAAALKLLGFLRSGVARRIFERHGFKALAVGV